MARCGRRPIRRRPTPTRRWSSAAACSPRSAICAREIRACEICHADAGVGIAPSFPYLAGQYADYTERQLLQWKAGDRRNDPLNVMAEIAERLEDEEIRALALYFARVRPPPAVLSSPIPAEPIPPPPEAPSLPE